MKNREIGPLTTIGDLTDQLQPYRDRLVENVQAGHSVVNLVDDLIELARQEGAIQVEHAIASARKNETDDEGIVKALILMVTRPADDTYSGRSNDIRRAYRDGLTRRVSEFVDGWAFRR